VTDGLFEGEEAVLHVIERIVAPLGLRVDESSHWVDARLSDGSQVQTRVLRNPLSPVSSPGRPGDPDPPVVRTFDFKERRRRDSVNVIYVQSCGEGRLPAPTCHPPQIHSAHRRGRYSQVPAQTRSGQTSQASEECEAVTSVHESERRVLRRVVSAFTHCTKSLHNGQGRVPVRDRVPEPQPIVDARVGVCRCPRHHALALTTMLRPGPKRARVEPSGPKQLPRVLGVRRAEVANLRSHSARKEAEGGARHCVVRAWSAQVDARQSQVLNDRLPRCDREYDDGAIDGGLLVPPPSSRPARPTVNDD
jgi:hypothetical protein